MPRMPGAQAWPPRVRKGLERTYQVTFVLAFFTDPLWSLLFGPRLGMLIGIPFLAVVTFIALGFVVVIARGGLLHVDPSAFQLGHRLGRPRTVAGAELWAWAVFAVFEMWAWAARLAPGITAPKAITEELFGSYAAVAGIGLLLLIAGAPLLLLYLIDWGQQTFGG